MPRLFFIIFKLLIFGTYNLRRAAPFPVLRSRFQRRRRAKNSGLAMAVRATVSRFPVDADAQENSGLPWGVAVTPFAAKDENGRPPAYGSDANLLPRCEHCWAYFNSYCDLEHWAWTCALCGTLNGLSSKAIARFSNPESCPEMMSSFIDLELPGQCWFSIRIPATESL